MIKYLWQWSARRDEWEFITTATTDKAAAVLRGYKRRNPKGTRFKWMSTEERPKKFRTRAKKEEAKHG